MAKMYRKFERRQDEDDFEWISNQFKLNRSIISANKSFVRIIVDSIVYESHLRRPQSFVIRSIYSSAFQIGLLRIWKGKLGVIIP